MKFEIKDSYVGDVYILFATEDEYIPSELNTIEDGLAASLTPMIEASRFRGKAGQTFEYTPSGEGPKKVILLGAGKLSDDNAQTLENYGGFAVKNTLMSGYKSIAIKGTGAAEDARILAGARLASYRFDKYMTKILDKTSMFSSVNGIKKPVCAKIEK